MFDQFRPIIARCKRTPSSKTGRHSHPLAYGLDHQDVSVFLAVLMTGAINLKQRPNVMSSDRSWDTQPSRRRRRRLSVPYVEVPRPGADLIYICHCWASDSASKGILSVRSSLASSCLLCSGHLSGCHVRWMTRISDPVNSMHYYCMKTSWILAALVVAGQSLGVQLERTEWKPLSR